MISIKNLKPKTKKNNMSINKNNHQIMEAYTNAKITKRDINDVIDFGIKYKTNKSRRNGQTSKNWSQIKTKSASKTKTKDHSQIQSQSNSKSKQNNTTSFHASNKASPNKAQNQIVGSGKKPKQSPTTPSKHHDSKKQPCSSKRNTIDLSTITNEHRAKQKDNIPKYQQYMTFKYNEIKDKNQKNSEQSKLIHNSPFRDILVNNNAYQNFNIKKSLNQEDNINENQFNRLLNLKQYLQQDTQRMTKLKKMSDQHVLSELGISQNALIKRVESANHQIQCIKNEAQRQLDSTNQHFQLILENNNREIDHLKNQLTQQRTKRVKIQCKVKETQVMMKCIKDELNSRQRQYQNIRKQAEHYKLSKKELEELLRVCRKEKQYIKQQAQDVLSVVRQQLMKTNN